MGIPVQKFLNKYLGSDDLRKILDSIGEPVGRTKKERIELVINNWQSYNRNWYRLLRYLNWGSLAQICEDFDIYFEDFWREETLCRKIEEARVLDYRKETMTKSKQKPVNSFNKKEEETKTGFLYKLYHKISSKRGILLTIILAVASTGIGMYWTSHVAETTTPTILMDNEIEKSQLDQNILDHYDSHKPYSIVWTKCGLTKSTSTDGKETWILEVRPLVLDSQGNEALIPFNTIYTISSLITDGADKEYSQLPNEPPVLPITPTEHPIIKLELNELFEKAREFQPSNVILMLEKDGLAPASKTTGNNLKGHETNNVENIFTELVYLPDLDTWVKDESNKDSICENLYQK